MRTSAREDTCVGDGARAVLGGRERKGHGAHVGMGGHVRGRRRAGRADQLVIKVTVKKEKKCLQGVKSRF